MSRLSKIVLAVLIVGGMIAAIIVSKYLKSNTAFAEGKKTIFIKTGSTFEAVLATMREQSILKDEAGFKSLANQLKYNTVKPGKYIIPAGMSNYTLVKKLRSGDQDAVQLVLKKYRTKQDLAHQISSKLEADSASLIKLLNDNTFLQPFGLDSVSSIGAFTPNTYEFYWNTTSEKVFDKIAKQYKKFWNDERLAKAKAISLSPTQVMTVASIVDEETEKDDEKGNVASVYLNRLKSGMKLQADPTVKYAIGDFTIRRVLLKHLETPSPYNTYFVAGLPPGPICTPRPQSVDAVLNAPATKYLFFCASPDKIGYHNFAATDAEHYANAKHFQEWLDKRGIKK